MRARGEVRPARGFLAWGSAALGAFVTIAGCGGDEASGTTIWIGALADQTGNTADPSRVKALEIATADINDGLARAEYRDLQIALAVGETTGVSSVALERLPELLARDVKAVILDISQASQDINRLFYDQDTGNDPEVPLLCTGCTSTALNDPTATHADPITQESLRNTKKWLYRTVMDTTLIAKVMTLDLLARGDRGDLNGDGKLKIEILAVDDVFGRSTSAALKTWAQTLHPKPAPLIEEIVVSAQLDAASYDWRADLGKLSDRRNETSSNDDGEPDVVMTAMVPGVFMSFFRAVKTSGFAVPILNPHSARSSLTYQSLGDLADGIEGISHLNFYGGPGTERYIEAYRAEHGEAPPSASARSYDAGFVVGLALVAATKDLTDVRAVTGEQMKAALRAVEDPAGERIGPGPDELARGVGLLLSGKTLNYEGLSGPLDWDENLNVRQDLVHYRAQGGGWLESTRYGCVESMECPQR